MVITIPLWRGIDEVIMSYTVLDGTPEKTRIAGKMIFEFKCPRCGYINIMDIVGPELLSGFTAFCTNQACTKPGDKPGFELEFLPMFQQRILGLLDRPLYTESEE